MEIVEKTEEKYIPLSQEDKEEMVRQVSILLQIIERDISKTAIRMNDLIDKLDIILNDLVMDEKFDQEKYANVKNLISDDVLGGLLKNNIMSKVGGLRGILYSFLEGLYALHIKLTKIAVDYEIDQDIKLNEMSGRR